jgi:hypothetical protein
MAELDHHRIGDQKRAADTEGFQQKGQAMTAAAADEYFAGHKDAVDHLELRLIDVPGSSGHGLTSSSMIASDLVESQVMHGLEKSFTAGRD